MNYFRRSLSSKETIVSEAYTKLDDRGRPIEEEDDLDLGDNCIIVPTMIPGATVPAAASSAAAPVRSKRKKLARK